MDEERDISSLQSAEIHGGREEYDCDFETVDDEENATEEEGDSQAVERHGAEKLQGVTATYLGVSGKSAAFSACASQTAHDFASTYGGRVCRVGGRGASVGGDRHQSGSESKYQCSVLCCGSVDRSERYIDSRKQDSDTVGDT